MNDPIASIGLRKDCELDKTDLEAGLRVTVKILSESKKVIKGKVVPPSTPREELGLYWGYSVRFAPTLTSVFTKSPFKGKSFTYVAKTMANLTLFRPDLVM